MVNDKIFFIVETVILKHQGLGDSKISEEKQKVEIIILLIYHMNVRAYDL